LLVINIMIDKFIVWLKRLKTIYLLVDLKWFIRLRIINLFSKKVKVGFGPVYTDESILGDRKFRIDPIVDAINKYSKIYVADIFTKLDSLEGFDIIVIVKNLDSIDYQQLAILRSKGKIILYDIIDNPAGCVKDFFLEPNFVQQLTGMILLSPLDMKFCKDHALPYRLIECPVTNSKFIANYENKTSLRLVWQGYSGNMDVMERLHPILEDISKQTGIKLELVYHTNRPSGKKGMVEYIRWRTEDWEEVLANADIGVVIKPLDDFHQQRKPSNKLITFMVAGLPIVCTPCEADKLLMKHGENGFFAYSDEDWTSYLTLLVQDSYLRKTIGQNARKTVLARNNPKVIAEQYTSFFEELSEPKAHI